MLKFLGSRRRMGIEKLEPRQMLAAVCSSGHDVFTVGLVDCTPEASEGYTLLAPNSNGDAFLLDIHGREVHSWTGAPYDGRRGAYVGEDGSLISTGIVADPAQGGGGYTGALYKQDWEGNLTWQFEYATADYTMHHDLEILPNGNILAFAWVAHSALEMIALGRDPSLVSDAGLWGERIMELESTGPTTANIVWEWNLIDHLIQDFDPTRPNFGVVGDHPERLDVNLGGTLDWLHFNTIDYNTELDQIVVGSTTIDELLVIDHSTTTAEAATSSGGNSGMGGDFLYRWGNPGNYGAIGNQQLFNPHDVQWIDPGNPGAGNFLILNNQAEPSTTILEIASPVDGAGAYHHIPGAPFPPLAPASSIDTGDFVPFTGGTQRLPNGNTIYIDGPSGEFVELNSSGNEVWEYLNPVTDEGPVSQGDPSPAANVFKTRRYPATYEGFVDRDLSPTGFVENWTQGDYDLNGETDGVDLQAMCGGLSTNDRIYDHNFDDILNVADVEEMVTEVLGLLMGDANLDGTVDGIDFIAWNQHKFQADDVWSHGDFNCDGFIDGLDFIVWNTNKFTSVPVFVSDPHQHEFGQRQSGSFEDAVFERTIDWPHPAGEKSFPQTQVVRETHTLAATTRHGYASHDTSSGERQTNALSQEQELNANPSATDLDTALR